MPAKIIFGDCEERAKLSAQIPRTMYEQLAKRAHSNHRTITREVIAIVHAALLQEENATTLQEVAQ